MKLVLTIKCFALAALLIAGALIPGISLAGAEAGVRCPNGFTANFNNGVLRCSKRVTSNVEIRKSVCPIILLVSTTYQRRAGADVCIRGDNGAPVATVPENAFDPQNYRRDVNGAGDNLDRFLKGGQTTTEFAFPVAVRL